MNDNFITGIEIKFNKNNNNYFEDEWDDEIDCELLIIALLETINDICVDNGLDTTKHVSDWLHQGSVDVFKELYCDEIKKYQSECFNKGE